MQRVLMFLILLVAAPFVGGCAHSTVGGDDVVFVVAGVNGAGGVRGVAAGLSRPGRVVRVVGWGAPLPLFFLNFSDASIHGAAERMLAERVTRWRAEHPGGRIDLVGHSAGCGVILGALARLGDEVQTVVLLAPSVSPAYDLRPALAHTRGTIHVFYSDRDTTFLSWRTSHFGTYDRVKTVAAGNRGFSGDYPPGKLVQHPYDPAWEQLGNDGGHFGTAKREFVESVVKGLVE